MKNLVLGLLLITVLTRTHAQMHEGQVINVLNDPAEIQQYEDQQLLKSTERRGEVYYLESPSIAVFESISGKKYKAKLNYNLVTNQVELYGSSRTFLVDPKYIQRIETIDSTSTKKVFENTVDMQGLNNPKVLVELLVDGPMLLLKEEEVSLSQATYFDRMGTGSSSGKYLSDTDYYIYDGTSYHVVRNRRDLLTVMEDKKNEIKKFIRINHLNVRDERHLSYVVEYYNKISS